MANWKHNAAISWPTRAAASAAAQPVDFRDVFQAHAAYVLTLLRRLGVSPGDVDDVAQEVFVTVHQKLAGFEGRSSLKTWISGICVHKARGHRRQRARQHARFVESTGAETSCAPDAAADLEQREQAALLERGLAQLSDEHRAVFVLYEIEELQMSEVAEVLGCPRFTAYTRLHAARRQLRSFFERARAKGQFECR